VGDVVYLYGLVKSADVEKLGNLTYSTFQSGNITAVYSIEDSKEFGFDAFKSNLKNMAWVEEKVIKHNQLLSDLAFVVTVLPVKFGAVYTSLKAMQATLISSQELFNEQLERVNNGLEWGFKLSYSNELLTTYLMHNDDEVKHHNELSLNGTSGQRFLAKKKIDTVIKAAIKREVNLLRNSIYEYSLQHSKNHKILPNTSKELSTKGWINVLNLALFIGRGEHKQIMLFIEGEIKEANDCGFRMELTGPWPAYNFVADE